MDRRTDRVRECSDSKAVKLDNITLHRRAACNLVIWPQVGEGEGLDRLEGLISRLLRSTHTIHYAGEGHNIMKVVAGALHPHGDQR